MILLYVSPGSTFINLALSTVIQSYINHFVVLPNVAGDAGKTLPTRPRTLRERHRAYEKRVQSQTAFLPNLEHFLLR